MIFDIYLSRHGRTEWNDQLRMQGRRNSPLTPEGIEGAKELGTIISDIPLTACITSPMPRALQTAQIALEGRAVPITTDDLLCEMDLGAWEGVQAEDAAQKWPDVYNNFRHNPHLFKPVADGETYFDTTARAKTLLENISARALAGTLKSPILLVSHMIMIQSILTAAQNNPVSTLRDIYINQAQLCHIRADITESGTTYKVLSVNNTPV